MADKIVLLAARGGYVWGYPKPAINRSITDLKKSVSVLG
jgi:hypothetical protein